MKKITLLILLVVACTADLHAQKQTFTRDYTYQASEEDSKNSARANATTQMRNILLREVGEFLHTERKSASGAYSETIEAITAGIVEMKTLDERWDGHTYYIKAEMTVDPKDLERRIAEVLNDKQKTRELEDARKRTLAAEAEAERLRKELKETKDAQQRLALKETYQQVADALSAEEYFTQGYNAQEGGFHELAIEYYQQAIAIDTNLAMAYNNMGIAYADLQDYSEAVRCYQKAIAIDTSHAMAYNNMGNAYYGLQDYREAIQHYQKAKDITIAKSKAKALDPDNAMMYHNIGNAYYNLQDYREAIRWYIRAIAIAKVHEPNNMLTYNNMGLSYANLQDYREAIRHYQKAIAANPDYADAYNNMGTAYANLGDTQEQIKNYQKAAQLGYEDAQAWLQKNGYEW